MSHPIPVDPISVDELLTEYMALLRAGKCPDIEDFCRRPGTDAAILKPLLVTATSLEQTRQRIDSQSQQSTINTRRRDLPHHQLGDFRLLREAGRGGMGIVYEAVEITLQRRVALKILDARNASSPVWLKRFQLEARAAALLHHTNIVPVFSVGECENIHYYVMPFIDGDPLSKVLSTLREKSADSETRQILGTDLQSRKANSPDVAVDSNVHRSQISEPTLNTTATAELPSTTAARSMSQRFTATKQKEPAYFRRVATICLQVAEAMDHAYQQGVLHRDIKPGNLILAFDGTVWVTDFGLARMTDSDDLTNTGEILGTLRYLAPERLRGQHTVQGDIYGLGVTMYELLTLQTAFAASERPELLRRVMEETPESPRRIDPSIPRDLETIVTRSIAKEVLHRYQLPSELVTDLRMFLEDRPILSRRISTAEIVWRWCRKNPGVATLLSTVAALLIVIAVGAVLWGTSLQRERDAAQRAENAAKFSEQSALAERRKAISSEGVAIEARRLAEESDRQRRQELFDVYLNDMATRYESDLRGHRLDGLQLARNALEVLPLAERTSHQQSRLRNATIACLGHADFAEIEKHPAADQLGHAIDIDPALRVLALPGADQQTDLRWLDGSESDRTLTEDPIPDLAGCDRWFSPCGRWLVEVRIPMNQLPQLRIWDWQKSKLALQIDNASLHGTPCFHPDGRQFFVVENARIHVYDLETGERLRRSPPRFKFSRLAISHDGRYLSSLVPMHPPVIIDTASFAVIAPVSEFEHGGVAAWHTKKAVVLIWNLHQLRNELHAIGLPAESLPMHEQTATNRQVRTLDRGQELLPPTGWWTGHEMLARYEALKLNYPDAIDRMDTALDVASPQDLILRSKLLMQRGEYHLLNNNPDEACADFREAVKFNPAEPANARRFVELLLFGPPDIRDPVEARRLLQDLVSLDEQNIQDRLNLILTDLHLHHLQTARIEFHQIADETVVAASPTARTAYRCVQICIERRSTAENVVVNPVDLQSSIAETQRLVDEARETASPNESAVLDEFCKLLEL